ncbi:calcium-binding protein PBP1-like [Camellia sinensis]|uniref:EF-hand domain-containing protein n=2 Tax=Camellia sinensis TaxID=4442 RepID=A0A7J7GF99_CAMSI|nr:calcium-binding protein PBP1-like [Camellia sinensis]KAF5939439.1 hypothetical protein HYC85_023698 [Camellia sinensis]
MKSISKVPHNKLPLASLLSVLSLAPLFNSFLGLFFFQFSYLTPPQIHSIYLQSHYPIPSFKSNFTFNPLMASKNGVVFEDFFPSMVEKLGAEGFMDELCNGFRLLMDGDKGVITFESLKKNSAVLGLQNMSDEELKCMLKEGDLDGDGRLNQKEFCVLMFRLSPELMKGSISWLEQIVMNEL